MDKKTYMIYFEGQIEIEADSDEEAVDRLKDAVCFGEVGYYKIYESDPDSLNVFRVVEG